MAAFSSTLTPDALTDNLKSDKAAEAVKRIMNAATDPFTEFQVEVQVVGQAVAALVPFLTPDQAAQVVFDLTVQAKAHQHDGTRAAMFRQPMSRLASRLAPDQVTRAMRRLTVAFEEEPDTVVLPALAQAIVGIGPTPEQAAQAVARLTDALQRTADNLFISELAQAIGALSAKLASDLAAQTVVSLTDALSRATKDYAVGRWPKGFVCWVPLLIRQGRQ